MITINLTQNQSLVFTNGICMKNNENNRSNEFKLISGNTRKNINIELTTENIVELEKKLNVKLIGMSDDENNEKIITIHNDILFDSIKYTKRLSDYGFVLREFVINRIFKNKDIFEDLFASIPIEIEFAGIDTKHFLSKEQLSSILQTDNSKINHKYLLYFDIQSVIDDAISQLVSCEKRIINIGIEQFNWLKNNKGEYIKNKEYTEYGLNNYKLQALYSDCIIGLRSCLDLITKLFYILYELKNYKGDFSSKVKFHYNSFYYSDAKKISNLFKLTNTIFENPDKYDGLSLIRNELVHNCFMSSIPQIYRGNGTNQVNYNDIDYMICFMWDLEKNKPINYLHRKRFFSQQNPIDKFILNLYLQLSFDIEKSLLELIQEFKLQ